MRRIKKIIIVCLIISILTPVLPPISNADFIYKVKTPGLTQEQQDYLAAYVRIYLSEAYTMNPRPFVYDNKNGGYDKHYHQNEWAISKIGQSGVSSPRGESYTNRIPTVCCVFTASMLHQVLGVELLTTGINGAAYSNPNGRGEDRFNKVQDDEPLQPGDVISWGNYGHSMLYIGTDPNTGRHQIAETCGGTRVIGINDMGLPNTFNGKAVTPADIRALGGEANGSSRYGHVARLKPEVIDPDWSIPEVTKIQWPNGYITEWDGEIVSTAIDMEGAVFYSGLADVIGSLGTEERIKTIWKGFNDIINYVIGLVTMVMRVPFVGLTSMAEGLVSSVIEAISTQPTDSTLTLEKIVYNQVPIFDVNLFNMTEAGGVPLTEDNVILTLRQNVAAWYYAFRNFVIVALLLVLLYLGIRMAITSIAEEKAQYKRMLVDWLVSFVMVLFIHYFLIIVMKLNDFFVETFLEQAKTANMTSLYYNIKEIAHDVNFTNGWYGTIMYIALVWFMIKYAWKYTKRLLSTFILIVLSPLVAISYAIDKIKDNRSQSLGRWLKEIAFTILIQSVHALIYTVFMVGIVSNIASNDKILEAIGACVFLVIAIKFMDAAESIFETIFGFNSSSVLKEVMDSTFEMFAKAKLVMKWGKTYFKGTWKVVKGVGKATNYSFRWLGKHNTRVGQWVENLDEVGQGYREVTQGRTIDDTPTSTGINKTILMERQKQAAILAKDGKLAHTAWSTSTEVVKDITMSMFGKTNIIENPMAAISYLIAGGVAIKEMYGISKRTIKSLKTDFKGTFRGPKEIRQKEAIMFEVRDKDIALTRTINEIYEGEDSLIAKGLKEGATQEEAKQARNLIRILNDQLAQAGKTVKSKETERGISNYIMNETKANKEVTFNLETVDQIVTGMERDNKKLKVDHKQYKDHLLEELKRAMQNKATGKVEGIKVKFGEGLEKQLQEKREKVTISANHMMLDDKKRQEDLEQALGDQIGEYLSDEKHVNEILEQLNVEDLANLMTRAMNREGSMRRNYELKYEPEEYEEAIGSAMEKSVPESLEDLEDFAVAIEQAMPAEKKQEIVPIFAENVRQELENMKKVIRGEEDAKPKIAFTAERMETLKEILQQDNISEDDDTRALFTSLTQEEKQGLFTEALKVEITPQMDAEIEKYNKVIDQAIELRESAQELARVHVPTQDVVVQIKEDRKRKAQK